MERSVLCALRIPPGEPTEVRSNNERTSAVESRYVVELRQLVEYSLVSVHACVCMEVFGALTSAALVYPAGARE
jgi:hypothetical protein